ncbi:hypothetical protein ACFQJ5_00180 [Halomicroarcula sp. GCM10025324]|uniref:hypothetical protein n=1 Tax=Haloarcula TaxID=2237 RepID=UPI0023E76FC9|nr:hypothetical protein [Halomicroarcula sp. ZS-22-S1]
MTDGEVAVREHDSVTVIEADSLDGEVAVDLDNDPPMVGVSENVCVNYDHSVDDGDEPEVETDGGYVREHVRVSHRGLGLTGELRNAVIAFMGLLYAAAGYLWAESEVGVAFIAFVGAMLLTYLLFSYNGGSDGGE